MNNVKKIQLTEYLFKLDSINKDTVNRLRKLFTNFDSQIRPSKFGGSFNTLRISKKDNMPFIFDTQIPAGAGKNFKIGVRHGNTHQPDNKQWSEHYSEFEQPVIVIGIDIDATIYNKSKHEILPNLEENADILLLMAEDAYILDSRINMTR